MNTKQKAAETDSRLPPIQKRSFLQLPVPINIDALLCDYQSIPLEAWATSHWSIHCSANTLLLRGGNRGDEHDYDTEDVCDKEILHRLPYISWLISEAGPFGAATYAFIFRMKPMGVTRPHIDDKLAWKEPFRIHVPITTNDGAFLMAEGRAQHLKVGEVWTFDNQSKHAVVNGDSVRAHLIMDVALNPKLEALLSAAQWHPGEVDSERWKRSALPDAPPIFSPAMSTPLSTKEKLDLHLKPESFASRVTERRWIAHLTRAPIRKDDVIYAVNGVEECPVARTATDYIHLRHAPGETLKLGLIRDGQRRTENLKLYRNGIPKSLLATLRRLSYSLSYR